MSFECFRYLYQWILFIVSLDFRMLKTRAVEQYLEQAITSGILGVFLFNSDGMEFEI